MIKFWGTRGSIPIPGRFVVKYGGNTPCVEVRCGNTILIFDAGSGIRELGASLLHEFSGRKQTYHILISHTHWDHIQGFPFFSVAYLPTTTINFYGGNGVTNLEKLIFGQMDREYFPVSLPELSSTISFQTMDGNPIRTGEITIRYTHMIHPTLSLGYRVEYRNRVFVYATDCELSNDPEIKKMTETNMDRLVQNADVLVGDSQYTAEEYEQKIGWGHSSIDNMISLAARNNVRNLFMFHHDPLHTDDDIDIMVENAKLSAPKGLNIYGAREKSRIIL